MEKLSKVDFTKSEGSMLAVGHQKKIEGLNRAGQLLVDLLNIEETADV